MGRQLSSRTVQSCGGIPGVGSCQAEQYRAVQVYEVRAIAEQNSTGLYRYTRLGQLQRRALLDCTGIRG